MSPAEMFVTLGAPLNNVRWSWGSVRDSDGTVFLRVWQDSTCLIDNKRYIWVSEETPPNGDLGANERLQHVKLVQSGNPCYLVMCQAVDILAAPRQLQSFNERELFTVGDVVIDDECYRMELKGRIPIKGVIS